MEKPDTKGILHPKRNPRGIQDRTPRVDLTSKGLEGPTDSFNNNSLINDSYKSIMGLDKQYGSMPSYKTGGGGSSAIEGLSKMMGGSIPNPYEFAKMTSSGQGAGESPYKQQLMGQEYGLKGGLMGQEYGLKSKEQASLSGYSSPEEMNRRAKLERQRSNRLADKQYSQSLRG